VVASWLEAAGYQTLAASDGPEALGICEQYEGPIHLLATDVVMPGMTGMALARQASRLKPGMSVLYLSGYGDTAGPYQDAVQPGAHFLGKPFEMEDLVSKVREILGKPKPGQG